MAHKTKLETLREIEAQLSKELKRLRATIRAAERGENARIKDTNKYIARQTRAITRAMKESEKIREQELERLEKFLGESFETLEEARKSFAKSTSKLVGKNLNKFLEQEAEKRKHKTEKQRQRRAIARIKKERERERNIISGTGETGINYGPTVRELNPDEKQRIIDFITDRNEWDSSGPPWRLKPGEKLTLNVTYKYRGLDGQLHTARTFGKKVVNSWEELRVYINTYNDDSESVDEWIGDMQVMMFPSQYSHTIAKSKQNVEQDTRREAVHKMFQEREKEERRKAVREAISKERAKQMRENAKMKAKLTPFEFDNWRREQTKRMRDEIRHIKQS